jgi:hypothetical protein
MIELQDDVIFSRFIGYTFAPDLTRSWTRRSSASYRLSRPRMFDVLSVRDSVHRVV